MYTINIVGKTERSVGSLIGKSSKESVDLALISWCN